MDLNSLKIIFPFESILIIVGFPWLTFRSPLFCFVSKLFKLCFAVLDLFPTGHFTKLILFSEKKKSQELRINSFPSIQLNSRKLYLSKWMNMNKGFIISFKQLLNSARENIWEVFTEANKTETKPWESFLEELYFSSKKKSLSLFSTCLLLS